MSEKNRLKELREANGLTLDELSAAIDIPKTSLSNYERGVRSPKTEVWSKLANLFNVDTPYIMGLSNSRTKKEADLSNYYLEEINKLINSTYNGAPIAKDIIVDISKIFNSLFESPSIEEMTDLKSITGSLEKLYGYDNVIFDNKEKTKEDIQLVLSNYQNILDILNKRVNNLTEKI